MKGWRGHSELPTCLRCGIRARDLVNDKCPDPARCVAVREQREQAHDEAERARKTPKAPVK